MTLKEFLEAGEDISPAESIAQTLVQDKEHPFVMRRITDVKAGNFLVKKKPSDRRVKTIQPGSKWIDRFQEALRLLTGSQPTIEMCKSWLADDNEDLQEWVNTQRYTPEWVQGIAIIDAARTLASQPVDGQDHQPLFDEDWKMNDQDKAPVQLDENGVDPW